ncbi:hypothetical protein H4582DRAFT_1557426 [Lactarius indigo]|nr:hypothetical protein H4582DRAFT_1557426 [Lactarius indigo]
MTGANYTGGKRNFARARFRDSTRRAQKSHFGRRRLEILSRGLGNAAQHNEEESSGISGILLEHARREISRAPEYMRSNRTEAPGTLSGPSSPFIPGHAIKSSKLVHALDNPSLRAEVNRILEFSRTVGLCNYPSSSRRRSGSASLISDVSFESRVGFSRRQNCYNGSPISEFSERQHPGAPVAPSSGNLETTGARTPHFGPFRNGAVSPVHRSRERNSGYSEPASDYGHQQRGRRPPQRKTQSIDTPEPQISQDRFSSGFSDRKFCAMDSFSPSFDALEFPTSPLPPSSPLASSIVHGSLLSLCQGPHVNEGTPLDFDTTPARGSCGADSSYRSGYVRSITPGFPSGSVPLRCLSHSHRIHKVPISSFHAIIF